MKSTDNTITFAGGKLSAFGGYIEIAKTNSCEKECFLSVPYLFESDGEITSQ
mgnify:CR=1 FL=1